VGAKKSAPASSRATKLTFRPLTAARWPHLEALFGERGACGGCWCMAWRRRRSAWEKGKGAGNKGALKRLVEAGPPPGVLAYAAREPVGWCAIAPREQYAVLENSRVLKRIDEQPVWSITCLFIARPWRRRGISAELIRAAAKYAAARGAKIVEGYPTEPRTRLPDVFVWTGLPSAFLKAGFREAHRWSHSRPIMRRKLRA